jgi:hypothetical protein
MWQGDETGSLPRRRRSDNTGSTQPPSSCQVELHLYYRIMCLLYSEGRTFDIDIHVEESRILAPLPSHVSLATATRCPYYLPDP